MLLTPERRDRIESVAFDFAAAPKRPVTSCNLCGGDRFVTLAHADRYGFPARADLCRRCGLVFLNPMLTAEAYSDFYRDVYRPLVSAYHGRRIDAETVEDEQEAYAGALADLLEPWLDDRRGGRLLDVGGSTGVVSAALAGRWGLAATVLDPAPDEAGRAQARGLQTAVGTIEEWQPPDVRFDVVLICQTIDHLLDITAALAKLRRLVTEDGVLFVDVVDFRAAYLRARSIEEAVKVDHPYSLTEATAEAFLARAGFGVLRTDYAADRLHVGYVCGAAQTEADALPDAASVERMRREIRSVQNAPHP